MRKYLMRGTTLFALILGALVVVPSGFAFAAPMSVSNATQQHAGNYYGSGARIAWTDPDLRTGAFTYNRTAVDHQVTGACFRYSEIGTYKFVTSGGTKSRALVVWDSGCNRSERRMRITTGVQHRYSQQYFSSNGHDYYNWYVDGSGIGSGQTNFSYSTTVTAGGEVGTGVESMGNTLAYGNWRLVSQGGGYVYVYWGGHTPYVIDPPYYNVNSSTDPDNAFYSVGN